MKKILSLLALLVTTVAAMAIDFTDQRSVTEVINCPSIVTDAKLTVAPNGDGTYNVGSPDKPGGIKHIAL
mgnify:CR=1